MSRALWLSQDVPSAAESISALASSALTTLRGSSSPTQAPSAWMPRELDRQALFDRICVRDPYFALSEVRVLGPGAVVAQVPVEQVSEGEASPLNAAEAGRHLAILGSCAASLLTKEGQHYYLARRASVERLHEGPLPRATGLLRGSARAEFKERRTASARTLLTGAEGQPLFAMSVDYNVLSAAAFQRLFQGARQDMRREPRAERGPRGEGYEALRQNPHGQLLPLHGLEREGDCLRGTLGPVSAELCKGHFAMYPVLPVAAVMSGLSSLAGMLLRQLVGNASARYLVTRGEVRAESLAYAGETVQFDAHRQVVRGRDHHFDCWASVSGRVVGTMELVLHCLD